MRKYYLPERTAAALNRYLQGRQPQNLGLLLDKYVPAEVINIEESKNKKKDERGTWLRQVETEYKSDAQLVSAAYNRWRSYTHAMQASYFDADIDWRLIVGLGGSSVLETDLTLHHVYGLPIIPGSALKGLTRTYAAMEENPDADGKLKPATKIEHDHERIQRIFGMQDRAGTVIFFDAFPKNGQARLVLDIMNPHYPKYYQKEAAPSNDQSPVPITFLAIEHTTYTFALALRQGVPNEHKDDLDLAKSWLQKALRNYGVGGKTSAGYGYFRIGNDQTEAPDKRQSTVANPEIKTAEGYISELKKSKNVAGEIPGYYQKWQRMKSEEARKLLARAIVEVVHSNPKYAKKVVEKPWYQDLQVFLSKENHNG